MAMIETYTSTQTANDANAASIPTLVTHGVNITDRSTGIRVTLSAESTRTLSGAGTLKAYCWNGTLLRWCRNAALDITLSSSHASVRDQTFPDMETFVGGGRLFYLADTVTVSAGTTVVLTIEVFR